MSFGCERPELDVLAIDIHPSLMDDEDALITSIMKEISRKDGPIEVGIGDGGARHRLVLKRAEAQEMAGEFPGDEIWLVSGGAAGVTSECLVDIAGRSPSGPPTFILLGRTTLDPKLEKMSARSDQDLENEKLKLKLAMESDRDDGKVTLREWNDAWQKVLRGVDIHKNLSLIHI